MPMLTFTRRMAIAAGVLAAMLIAAGGPANRAAAAGTDSGACLSCGASSIAPAVDPSTYKTWPSGARTLLDVKWAPSASTAQIALTNQNSGPTQAFALNVLVDYHDPLTQTSQSTVQHAYLVPALDPQSSTTISVPLDFAQCDVFITLDFGSGLTLVFRTGNPAAC
jgi:hypothetical protein